MKITSKVGSPFRVRTDLLGTFVFEGEHRLATDGPAPPAPIADVLRGPLKDFRGRPGDSLVAYGPSRSPVRRILLVGLGKRKGFKPNLFRAAAGTLARRAWDLSARSFLARSPPGRDLAGLGRAFAEGIELATYRFLPYKTNEASKKDLAPRSATLFLPGGKWSREVSRGVKLGQVLARSANLTRDLGNTPSNTATPSFLATKAREIARRRGLVCRILQEREMKRLGMGALLGVARGSRERPRFIILEYKGSKRPPETIVLVGKGITFDSGGISLKPALKMEDMKFDMCGGAAVLGAMDAIPQLGLRTRVIGLVPCTENLPGGSAQKPGDVVRTLSGKTIEVINTDAEGRLILADALAYARRYSPSAVIDLATLTGAVVVALGNQAAGLMGTDDRLLRALTKAGERSGERVWQLPLWPEYKKQIESVVADVKNTGGRAAGTITAGLFLREFVGDLPWAHLDIAGVAWTDSTGPTQEKGATGFGVRILVEFLLDREAR